MKDVKRSLEEQRNIWLQRYILPPVVYKLNPCVALKSLLSLVKPCRVFQNCIFHLVNGRVEEVPVLETPEERNCYV